MVNSASCLDKEIRKTRTFFPHGHYGFTVQQCSERTSRSAPQADCSELAALCPSSQRPQAPWRTPAAAAASSESHHDAQSPRAGVPDPLPGLGSHHQLPDQPGISQFRCQPILH